MNREAESKYMARQMVAVSIIITAAFLSWGCDRGHRAQEKVVNPLSTAEVQTILVTNRSHAIVEELACVLQSKARATLESKLSGRIEEITVVSGDKVKKGESIVKLDAGDVAARLEQAEASLEDAERQWKRNVTLFEQQSTTHAEHDAAQSRLRSARGAVAEAKAMLGYGVLSAPFDGVVTRKWANVGDLATPGKPLVEIEDPSFLQVETDVPESIIGYIQPNAPFSVRVDSAGEDAAGRISEISPAADPVSRTFRVKLDLVKPSGLKSGQFARLRIPMGKRESVFVPAATVVQRGQLEILFIVNNQHADCNS